MTGYRIKPTPADPAYIASKAMHDPSAARAIAVCTRGDRIAWQNVAQMLGRPEHSVRAEYDPTYLRTLISETPA